MDPSASTSRTPRIAACALMPPPTMRYLQVRMAGPFHSSASGGRDPFLARSLSPLLTLPRRGPEHSLFAEVGGRLPSPAGARCRSPGPPRGAAVRRRLHESDVTAATASRPARTPRVEESAAGNASAPAPAK